MRCLHSLLIIGLFGVSSLMAQQIPQRKPILLREYADYIAPNSIYIVGQLIPVGFSPDGKFAYVVEPPDEACGCYFFELHIRDLHTDKDVWLKKLLYEGVSTEQWDRAWKENGKAIWEQLHSHGIVMANVTPSHFPIASDGSVLRLTIDRKYMPSPFLPDEKFIRHAQVYLSTDSFATKRVASLDYSDQSLIALDAAMYLHSPFEDRAAIILLRTKRGWEGPPSPIDYEVIGALLKTGFRQKNSGSGH